MTRNYLFTFMTVLCAVSVLCAAVSCDGGEDGGPGTLTGDATFILESAGGSADTAALEFNGPWEVTGAPSWCDVSPASGEAGKYVLTVTASSVNEDFAEREGVITVVVDGSAEVGYQVYQRGVPGLRFSVEDAYASDGGGEIRIPAEGNIDMDPSFISCDSDWIGYVSAEASEPSYLSDGETLSEYWTGALVLSVSANGTGAARDAVVALNAGGVTSEVTVHQVAPVDWDRTFYRRSTLLRFTATWCGFCPIMNAAFEQAVEEKPGRFVAINVHPYNSEGGLSWEGTEDLQSLYGVTDYPSAIFNGFAKFINTSSSGSTARIMTLLADEAVEDFPSQTNIMAAASTTGNRMVQVDAFIAAREDGNYRVTVMVLENGIVYQQTDYSAPQGAQTDYVHNHIVRGALTDVAGDPVAGLTAGTTAHVSVSGTLPASISDMDNAYVVVFVTRDADAGSGVPQVTVLDTGEIVDNVVEVPLDGMTEYKYEE